MTRCARSIPFTLSSRDIHHRTPDTNDRDEGTQPLVANVVVPLQMPNKRLFETRTSTIGSANHYKKQIVLSISRSVVLVGILVGGR